MGLNSILGVTRKYKGLLKLMTLGATASFGVGLTGCSDRDRPFSEPREPEVYEVDAGTPDTSEPVMPEETIEDCIDFDNDGYSANCGSQLDCNDLDPLIHPNAVESCNSKDDDCNGITDDGVLKPYFQDSDEDGFGNIQITAYACPTKIPPGFVPRSGDCRDDNPLVFPRAEELCNGYDDDCDGGVDEQCACVAGDSKECGDFGHGECNKGEQVCDINGLWSDCAGNRNPVEEICDGLDNDCDTFTDDGVLTKWYRDEDGDTYGNPDIFEMACDKPEGFVDNDLDCDDTNPRTHPGVLEVCNNVDDDCNGLIDENVTIRFWEDQDNDGYGDSQSFLDKCEVPPGYVENNIDCAPLDESLWRVIPGYTDNDGDLFGAGEKFEVCAHTWDLPENFRFYDGDCDDDNPLINPDMPDVCDGLENDCNLETLDGDGEPNPLNDNLEGVCANSFKQCIDGEWQNVYEGIVGYGAETCDSLDNDCNPLTLDGADDETPLNRVQEGVCEGSEQACFDGRWQDSYDNIVGYGNELCDGLDNDCDPNTRDGLQEGAPLSDNLQGVCANSFKECLDGEWQNAYENIPGYGAESCDGLDNDCNPLTADGSDDLIPLNNVQFGVCEGSQQICEDGRWQNNFSDIVGYGRETCDGLDNDCDPATLDGSAERAPLNDNLEGVCANSFKACIEGGWANHYEDIQGYGNEICDGVDNDCDGVLDNELLRTFYRDFDGDGRGDFNTTLQGCVQEEGWVLNADDCNDRDAGKWEIRRLYVDNDLDRFGAGERVGVCAGDGIPEGYANGNGDCNDFNAQLNPAMLDVCDGIDNDCNPQTQDGAHDPVPLNDVQLGVCAGSLKECREGHWQSSYDGIIGYGDEVCDLLDNNCDGVVNEGVELRLFEDRDRDGYGNINVSIPSCEEIEGFVENATDCDDLNARYWQLRDAFVDSDEDGFGAGELSQICMGEEFRNGYARVGGDCDNNNNLIYPFAREVCDGLNNDCLEDTIDGSEDVAPLVEPQLGVCVAQFQVCEGGEWLTDYESIPNYSIEEICDEFDNNCSGEMNEGVWITYFMDADGDGFGVAEPTIEACEVPEGYAENTEDCDDTNALINPDVEDICNSINDDCDLQVDEDAATCEKLVFSHWEDDFEKVYVAHTNGEPVVNLTPGLMSADQPKWRPDGAGISYYAEIITDEGFEQGLYFVQPDGSNREMLLDVGYVQNHAWFPDSERVALIQWNNGNYDVFVYNIANGQQRQLTNNDLDEGYSYCANAVISPDGNKVAYVCDERRPVIDENGVRERDLEVNDRVYVYDMETEEETRASSEDWNSNVSFSGDSSRMVYENASEDSIMRIYNLETQEEEDIDSNFDWIYNLAWNPVENGIAVLGGARRTNVYTILPNGEQIINHTNVGNNEALSSGKGTLTWSPDGTRFTYRLNNYDNAENGGTFTQDAQTGERVKVAPSEYYPRDIDWAPALENEEE